MILLLPATSCLLLFLVHSLYCRPFRANLILLPIGFWAAALYGGREFYIFHIPQIEFHRIPVVHFIGFFFAFYAALNLSIRLFESRERPGTIPFFRLLSSTVVITSLIGIAIEYSNEATGWWEWQVETNWLQLLSAWAWRPLLVFPLILQFFVPADAEGKRHRRLFVYAVLWLVVFVAWITLTDRITILRVLAPVIWLVLVCLGAKCKRPVVSLDLLRFKEPKPLRPRVQEFLARRHARAALPPG